MATNVSDTVITRSPLTTSDITIPVGDDTNVTINKDNTLFYQNRLKTFENWMLTFISPETMANAGFYYTGFKDRVSCYYCREIFDYWKRDDDPCRVHVLRSPRCQFLIKYYNNMVTLSDISRFINSVSIIIDPSSLKFVNQKKYVSLESRLQSFGRFKGKGITQELKVLCRSGLVYVGDGIHDEMICFCCGYSIMNWEINDDPWIEHARRQPKCIYLRLCLGNNLVKSIERRLNMMLLKNKFMLNSRTFYDDIIETLKPIPIESLKKFISSGLNDDYVEPYSSTVPIPEALLCKICYIGRIEVLLRPCGHVIACIQCAITLKECSICRRTITIMIRIGVYGEIDDNNIDDAMCMMCKKRSIQAVSIPCRHATTCIQCTEEEQRCFICFNRVYAYLHVYI